MVYQILKEIFSVEYADFALAEATLDGAFGKCTKEDEVKHKLTKKLWWHKKQAMKDIGLASNLLYESFGHPKIVLGSSIAEQLGKDETFQRMVGNFTTQREVESLEEARSIIEVSRIGAEVREAAGALPRFFRV